MKNILNRILWTRKGELHEIEVSYLHHGAPDDTKRIKASSITKLGGSWFTLNDDESTLIPFHRVKVIQDLRTGQTYWIGRSFKPVGSPPQQR